MSEEAEVTMQPSQILSEDILKFTQEMECLHTTLPLIMLILSALQDDTHKKYKDFIDKHATDKSPDENQISYSYLADEVANHDRLKRQFLNSRNAMKLIPRHFITSLVSQYDSFLGRVIHFIFAVQPKILNASEKSIPFTELIAFPSIDAAREFIIEKEVESVIRKSHVEQFSWLKEKLGTPFNKDLKSWPDFVELNECRNLFVHCDGRVSSQYLKVCSEHKCTFDATLKVGDQLNVAPDYFENAYKCVYEIGVKLAHVIWRRLCPEQLEQSDVNIIEVTYGLIVKGEFEIAIRLLDYFTQDQIKPSNDNNKRFMIINRAQAYKWAKDDDTCNKILSTHDWSACGDNFKLAVSVLRDNYTESFSLMRKLKHDNSFHKAFYKDWPLFRRLRKHADFPSVYEECYGELFKVEQKTEQNEKPFLQLYWRQEAKPAHLEKKEMANLIQSAEESVLDQ